MESRRENAPQENDQLEQDLSPVQSEKASSPLAAVADRDETPERASVADKPRTADRHKPLPIRMSWRLASRLSVITLAILVIALVMVIQQQRSSVSMPGTDLGNQPAPNFTLTDQNGKQISLAQFKGKPVILTFMYTHCRDACPLTAERLHSTLLSMGSNAKNVGILAVTTDPMRDDQAAALQFTDAHNMQNYWHFLIGTQQQLAPVWSAYSVYAQQQQMTINHTSGLYVIDKQGNMRLFVDQDFKPDQLASYLSSQSLAG